MRKPRRILTHNIEESIKDKRSKGASWSLLSHAFNVSVNQLMEICGDYDPKHDDELRFVRD